MADRSTLDEYARKRDFGGTPEPRGEVGKGQGEALSFVIQKHDASHLHYDFRLEFDGVLKSWAVPKGPCLDPAVKRLAVEVEDHPLDYADFEGHIPHGHYGAGDVIVWDHGQWLPLGDPRQGLESGHLKFRLLGQKLAGSWNLVRTRMAGRKPQWFLIKGRDDEARDFPRYDVLQDKPLSIVSGRALPGEAESAPVRRATRKVVPAGGSKRRSKAALPDTLTPQLATLVETPPSGEWRYEIKLDGYRILARIEQGQIRLLTRNGHDWSAKLPQLCAALSELGVEDAWLDGEILVMDEEGRPDFQLLQNAFEASRADLIRYTLFDLLWHQGQDLRRSPLEERRAALQQLLGANRSELLRYSEDFTEDPRSILDSACRLGLEGLIGKRVGSTYSGRRSNDWIKLKCKRRQEFVIVGFTAPKGSRQHFGALLLGLHDQNGELRYAGKVGTGFTADSLASIHRQLLPLARKTCPLASKPAAQEVRGATWLKPTLLCEVAFAEITQEGRVRQAVFQGLRTDKPAQQIVAERPAPVKKASRGSHGAEVAGVVITHPGRVIDTRSGLTKLDLAEYYAQAAERILPWLADRPVSLLRAPEGVGGEQFFQRHASRATLPGVEQLPAELDPGHAPLLRITSAKALAGVAQMGVVELHTWNASLDDLERPDRFVLDLDPDPALPWQRMIEATQLTLALLDELGLKAFLKTSGGKGMHVLVPLQRSHGWDEVKDFAHGISRHMAQLLPDRFSAVSGPKNRVGKIFIDYLRNSRGASTVCAWSVRAREGLPVSVPVAREELETLPGANAWTLTNVEERLVLQGDDDPWQGWRRVRQRLTQRMWQQLGNSAVRKKA